VWVAVVGGFSGKAVGEYTCRHVCGPSDRTILTVTEIFLYRFCTVVCRTPGHVNSC
jgi:hypothetical protein